MASSGETMSATAQESRAQQGPSPDSIRNRYDETVNMDTLFNTEKHSPRGVHLHDLSAAASHQPPLARRAPHAHRPADADREQR